MAKPTRRVEFLRAFEERTWDTFVEEVPTIEHDKENGVDFSDPSTLEHDLVDYITFKSSKDPANANVVLYAVYHYEESDE